ncbi:MAG TPA: thioredoxin [Thermoanaerobaculia bacterium]|jgi:thioredoxin 2
MSAQILTCPSCGASNRVPVLSEGSKAVCGRCKTPLTGPAKGAPSTGGGPVELSDANFRTAIAQGRYVVDFWAGWCGPCRTIAPVIQELAASRTDVRFAKLNVDENPRTSTQFGVRSIPLLVFFKDGMEAGRLTGAVPRASIEQAITRFLG